MPDHLATYDLHLHTYWSYDADVAPVEYLRRAAELGLRAFAVTDHHNFDGYAELRQAAQAFPGVRFLTGAEMSARTPFGVQDIVCLGFNPAPDGTWKRILERSREMQCEWGEAISSECLARGIPFGRAAREKALRSYRPAHVMAVQGITHVKSTVVKPALLALGMKDVAEFYDIVRHALSDDAYLDAREVVEAVHQAGGLAFWAHPYDYRKEPDEAWLDALCEYAPVDGLECSNSGIPLEMVRFYRGYCLRHRLLSSAGSDTHAFPQSSPTTHEKMAAHLGEDLWLDEILERLHAAHRH
jgi:predicted metal-dependent phosphoesterase TrpH